MSEKSINIHEPIIERCRLNDRDAQRQLYLLYAKSMLNTSFRILNSLEDAEDATQESFVSAFKHIHQYNSSSTFGAWLRRIVINKSLTMLKKKRQYLSDDTGLMQLPADDQADLHNQNFNLFEVKEAIQELPDGFRQVLVLYLIEGYDHVEISEILSISVSTSKSQYMRAKARLREILREKMKAYG